MFTSCMLNILRYVLISGGEHFVSANSAVTVAWGAIKDIYQGSLPPYGAVGGLLVLYYARIRDHKTVEFIRRI